MNNYRPIKSIFTIISILTSLVLMGYFAYLSFLHIYWFIPLSVYFFFEAIFTLLSITKRDPYDGMRIQGVFQVITVFLTVSYLLAMILWDDLAGTMVYMPTYIVLGTIGGIKLITSIVNYILIKRSYEPMLHAYRNSDLITLLYIIIILTLTVSNYYYPGTGNGLLEEKPLWIYIIMLVVNSICSIFAALLALSTDIRSKTKEPLSAFGKVKHVFKWVGDNEVVMFFTFIFTFNLIFVAILNVNNSIFYIFVAVYYFIIAFIRFINYLWHKSIVSRCKGNIIKENRKSSFILLFNALMYTLFVDLLCVGMVFLMIDKATNVGMDINLLLFILIPLCILRFVFAGINIKNHSKGNNTYRVGLAYLSLISAFFSLCEIVAILTRLLPEGVTALRYTIIIVSIIAIKVLVLIIALIFVIYFFRSIILNRRKKEKALRKEKEQSL